MHSFIQGRKEETGGVTTITAGASIHFSSSDPGGGAEASDAGSSGGRQKEKYEFFVNKRSRTGRFAYIPGIERHIQKEEGRFLLNLTSGTNPMPCFKPKRRSHPSRYADPGHIQRRRRARGVSRAFVFFRPLRGKPVFGKGRTARSFLLRQAAGRKGIPSYRTPQPRKPMIAGCRKTIRRCYSGVSCSRWGRQCQRAWL